MKSFIADFIKNTFTYIFMVIGFIVIVPIQFYCWYKYWTDCK
jgi:hypothetical protein